MYQFEKSGLFLPTAFLLALVFGWTACQTGGGEGSQPTAADSTYGAILMDHLRANFDDIHDVSMRFHHRDHTIGGLIVFETVWESGVLDSISVVRNDTGNDELPVALIEKFNAWNIEGLDGPFSTSLPLRIQLVGSDDPDFENTAVVTGTVTDELGEPVHRAVVEFSPISASQGPVLAARTNREGVFVRTLVPPGEWTLTCRFHESDPVVIEGVLLEAGQHLRETIVLER